MWAALALGAAVAVGCGSVGGDAPRTATAEAFRSYEYVAIDGRRISSDANRGRVTVIVLIATFDLVSQVVVEELSQIFQRQRPPINAGAIVLEPPRNAPLVEAFARTLEVPFPVALADPPTLEARGPFGEAKVVPTTIVLSPDGVETWRREGSVSISDIERSTARARRGR